MAMINPELERLIETLDPYRNYGERTYEQVVAEVRGGLLRLTAVVGSVDPHPFITDTSNGMRVKGTAIPPMARGTASQFNRKLFRERAAADFNEVYSALIQACKNLDSRALKIWLQYFIGDPERVAFEGASEEALKLMAKMLEIGKPGGREIIIDTTGRVLDE